MPRIPGIMLAIGKKKDEEPEDEAPDFEAFGQALLDAIESKDAEKVGKALADACEAFC